MRTRAHARQWCFLTCCVRGVRSIVGQFEFALAPARATAEDELRWPREASTTLRLHKLDSLDFNLFQFRFEILLGLFRGGGGGR